MRPRRPPWVQCINLGGRRDDGGEARPASMRRPECIARRSGSSQRTVNEDTAVRVASSEDPIEMHEPWGQAWNAAMWDGRRVVPVRGR